MLAKTMSLFMDAKTVFSLGFGAKTLFSLQQGAKTVNTIYRSQSCDRYKAPKLCFNQGAKINLYLWVLKLFSPTRRIGVKSQGGETLGRQKNIGWEIFG